MVDNVGAHKPERMAELVHVAGRALVLLPAYPPDLSPVEEACSKIKTRVKAVGARTHQALDTAIAAALKRLPPPTPPAGSPTPATSAPSPPENRRDGEDPKVRSGSFFPSLLALRRRIDVALHAGVRQAWVEGLSTREVDDLLAALGVESGIS